MAVRSNSQLRTYFETGDKPTQAQFIDLIDTITASNLKTIVYTVGVAGTTGCNHLFTSVADMLEQSIQLGGTTIIPVNSRPLQIAIKCVTGLSGAVTGTTDVGRTSGSNEFIGAVAIDDTNEMTFFNLSGAPGVETTYSVATSVFFSFTPNANWNTITTGKWSIKISYIDNSTN